MDAGRSFTLIQSAVISLLTLSQCFLVGVWAQGNAMVFDVLKFGAVGDGKTNDTQAFGRAWAAARQQGGTVEFVVPEGKTFLVAQSKFKGPCNASVMTFRLLGNIVSPDYEAWKKVSDKTRWLSFEELSNFHLEGPTGSIDGRGSTWWPHHCSISRSQPCYTEAPAAVTFWQCQQVRVNGLILLNAAKGHVLLSSCHQCNLMRVQVSTPADSPNNDGILVTSSENVNIDIGNIATGDDCVSIGSESKNVNISNINCGPGGGISIGSHHGEDSPLGTVQWVNVRLILFTGTSNGVRIYTQQGRSGYIQNVVFAGLTFDAVTNPIMIDNFYCDTKDCAQQKSAVRIGDVSYIGVSGTSKTDVAINLTCSGSVPCTGLSLQDVNVTNAVSGKPVSAFCRNAQGLARGFVTPPVSCLSSTSR